jgi:serpin B
LFLVYPWDLNIFISYSGDPSGSLEIINRWAALNTLGAINRVFSHPLPATTAAVLTNAIYFKGAWETPFNSQYTVPGKFKYNDTHRIDVQFMRGQFNLKYAESNRLGCRMISIPYKHDQAAMYAILPDTGDLYNIHDFASGLSLHDVTELINSTRTTSVTLIMPKMRLAQTFSIRKALSVLQKQIESQFEEETFSSSLHQNNTNESEPLSCCSSNCSENCPTFCSADDRDVKSDEERFSFNMSGISTDENFRINDMVQHVFLEVNEMGTVAAAVGTTLVDYSGEFKDFKMNRPFVFFIRHEITGAPLFWGIIVDPSNENT